MTNEKTLVKLGLVALAAALLFAAGPAHAACTNPTAPEGAIVYNGDYHTMTFCSGTAWVNMAGGGGAEIDPKVGALAADGFCQANAGGTAIVCTSDATAHRTALSLGGLATLSAVGSSQITDGTIAAVDLNSDSVTEPKLKAVNAATDEQCLTYETTTGDFEWQACGGTPSGTAGGDLSGSYPNPTVAKINGATLGTTTATAGNLLLGSGTQWASTAVTGDVTITSGGVTSLGADKVLEANLKAVDTATDEECLTFETTTGDFEWQACGGSPSGTAGGDLSGTYPNPAVAKINGATLGTTTATAGNLLIGSGTQWASTAVTGDVTITSGGVTAIGTGKVTTATIADNAVSNAKSAQMAANTLKGNNTGATANAIDLTVAQATAMLSALVGANGTVAGTKGLVPAPAATDNVKFLKGDGTWATVSGATVAADSLDFVDFQDALDLDANTDIATGTFNLTITNDGTGDTLRVNDNGTADTTPFVIDASGNVGIGTTAPTAKLDFNAGSKGTNTYAARFTKARDGANANYYVYEDVGGLITDASGGSLWRGFHLASPAITESGINKYPRLSFYAALNSLADPTIRYWGIDAGNEGTNTRFGLMFRTANADRMLIDALGNVGIGATDPKSLLHVASTGYAQFSKTFAGAPTSTDCDAADEAGRVTYDTTGNAWYVCEGAGGWVNTQATASVGADTLDFDDFTDTMALDASTDIAVDGTEVLSVTNAGTGNSFRVNDDGTTTDSTPFVIDSAGNVGIGTATPQTTLHLYNSTSAYLPQALIENQVADATSGYLLFRKGRGGTTSPTSGDGLGSVTFQARDTAAAWRNSAYISAATTGAATATYVPSAMSLNTTDFTGTNAARVYIDGDGEVGIGTSTPSSTFHVNGEARFAGDIVQDADNAGALHLSGATTTTAGANVILYPSGRGDAFDGDLRIRTATTDRIYVDGATGNVGIGTTPDHSLHVKITGAGGNGLKIEGSSATTSTPFIRLTNGSTATASFGSAMLANHLITGTAVGDAALYTHSTNSLLFGTNTTERMRIDASGNVGLGTATPNASALLDVTSTTKGFLPPRMTTTQRNAITSPASGLMIFNTTDGNYQYYGGSSWIAIGNLPNGVIAAFASASCPAGWTEYTAARGRFLRGIDNGAGIDPDGTRAAGSTQADGLGSHLHSVDPPSTSSSSAGAHTHTYTSPSVTASYRNTLEAGTNGNQANIAGTSTSSAGAHTHSVDIAAFNSVSTGISETRPKNIAVTFCQFVGGAAASGFTGSGSSGHVPYWQDASTLTYDNNGNFYWDAANNELGIGTASPLTRLHLAGTGANTSALLISDTDAAANIKHMRLYVDSGKAYFDVPNDAFSGVTSQLMTFDFSTGNVGVGTTAAPTERVDLGGGNIKMGYEQVNSACTGTACVSATATCSAGKYVLGGGCSLDNTTRYIYRSYPSGNNTWYCHSQLNLENTASVIRAYAICANIR